MEPVKDGVAFFLGDLQFSGGGGYDCFQCELGVFSQSLPPGDRKNSHGESKHRKVVSRASVVSYRFIESLDNPFILKRTKAIQLIASHACAGRHEE